MIGASTMLLSSIARACVIVSKTIISKEEKIHRNLLIFYGNQEMNMIGGFNPADEKYGLFNYDVPRG
jgi:hypothetical protein